jgi:hypothetical protein
VTSQSSDFRVNRVAKGWHLRTPSGPDILVERQPDGVLLKGDGFAHSIRAQNDTVIIESLAGERPPVSFLKPAILEDSQRVALGVASTLIGIPVNLLTGDKPEPVYVNLAYRKGVPRFGSSARGRHRVSKMERQLDGAFRIQIGQEFRRTIALTDSQEGEVPLYTANLVSKSGWPLAREYAFFKMTGNQFAETFSTGIAEIWRHAGKPGDAGQAAKVANYIFDLAYAQRPEDDGWYRLREQADSLIAALQATTDSGHTWAILSEATAKQSAVEEVLKALGAPDRAPD